ncbi:HFL290Wp [Eremothecium sinecaudum]|uniref:Phosphatidyl-N-methylethanolamine N-methyltransferase n=1 Tax=Eremothecium sinecaudum TaxID=45286 RepID=A0A0X8HTK2_9SACH|nr:HFL290Wp [Eremothecium sinecaudum]AMD21566.1 HFL290Wp [Eremothecium sinecaudum]
MSLKDFSIGSFHDVFLQVIADIRSDDRYFALAAFFIAFNPIYWNIVGRLEYKTHFITKILGSKKRGCYLFAFSIFTLGLVRDYYFHKAIGNQVTSKILDSDLVKLIGLVISGIGQVLVLTSMYKLGVTGTYLGDHFGILMDHRVTSFPFNVSDNPMYQGSTLTFLGTSLYYGKAAGLFLTLLVNFMYTIALKFEEPFTAMVYAKRGEQKANKDK